MDKKAMIKRAAQVLREQQREIQELHEKIARDKIAEQIVRVLIENSELLAEDVLVKLAELRQKPIGDLEVMEKAASMYRNTFSTSFGELSDKQEFSSNPLLDYLLGENQGE